MTQTPYCGPLYPFFYQASYPSSSTIGIRGGMSQKTNTAADHRAGHDRWRRRRRYLLLVAALLAVVSLAHERTAVAAAVESYATKECSLLLKGNIERGDVQRLTDAWEAAVPFALIAEGALSKKRWISRPTSTVTESALMFRQGPNATRHAVSSGWRARKASKVLFSVAERWTCGRSLAFTRRT